MTTEIAQQLLEHVCTKLDIDPLPELLFKEVDRGGVVRVKTADGTRTTMTLPVGVFQHGEAFLKYYIVHECTHLQVDSAKHDKAFKLKEEENLRTIFDIGIEHSRSYPKALYCLLTDKLLWGQSAESVGLGPCVYCLKETMR